MCMCSSGDWWRWHLSTLRPTVTSVRPVDDEFGECCYIFLLPTCCMKFDVCCDHSRRQCSGYSGFLVVFAAQKHTLTLAFPHLHACPPLPLLHRLSQGVMLTCIELRLLDPTDAGPCNEHALRLCAATEGPLTDSFLAGMPARRPVGSELECKTIPPLPFDPNAASRRAAPSFRVSCHFFLVKRY